MGKGRALIVKADVRILNFDI